MPAGCWAQGGVALIPPSALELLCELVRAGPAALSECVATLHRLHYVGPNGIKVYYPDTVGFDHEPALLRAPDSYVGMTNGGATCYMNSVFQQVRLLMFASVDRSVGRSVDQSVD